MPKPIPHPPWCLNSQHGAETDHVGRFEVIRISDTAVLTMVVKQDPKSSVAYSQWQLLIDGSPISTVPVPTAKLREIHRNIGGQLASLNARRGRRGNDAPDGRFLDSGWSPEQS